MSAYETKGPLMACTSDTTRDIHLKLENVKFWCVTRGITLANPINPYLGERVQKTLDTFIIPRHFSIFTKLHFWAQNNSMSPGMNQGGEGVAEKHIVSKGLMLMKSE